MVFKPWNPDPQTSEEQALSSWCSHLRGNPVEGLPDLWEACPAPTSAGSSGAQRKRRASESWVPDFWRVGAVSLLLGGREFRGHSLSPGCWEGVGQLVLIALKDRWRLIQKCEDKICKVEPTAKAKKQCWDGFDRINRTPWSLFSMPSSWPSLSLVPL